MDNVVSFNDKPLPEWVRVTGITFPALPELTHKEHEVSGRYGNVDSGVEIGGKTFSLEVLIKLDDVNIQDRVQELKAWLKGSGWENTDKLVFEESPDYYYLARNISSVDVNDLFMYGTGSIEFRASDGIRYDRRINKLPFIYSELVFFYSGQEQAPITVNVDVSGDVSGIALTHLESDKQLLLNGDFKNGDSVVLDNSKKVVKVNESTDMNRLKIGSRWLYLDSGKNTLRLSVEEGSVESLDVTLEYQERN